MNYLLFNPPNTHTLVSLFLSLVFFFFPSLVFMADSKGEGGESDL